MKYSAVELDLIKKYFNEKENIGKTLFDLQTELAKHFNKYPGYYALKTLHVIILSFQKITPKKSNC